MDWKYSVQAFHSGCCRNTWRSVQFFPLAAAAVATPLSPICIYRFVSACLPLSVRLDITAPSRESCHDGRTNCWLSTVVPAYVGSWSYGISCMEDRFWWMRQCGKFACFFYPMTKRNFRLTEDMGVSVKLVPFVFLVIALFLLQVNPGHFSDQVYTLTNLWHDINLVANGAECCLQNARTWGRKRATRVLGQDCCRMLKCAITPTFYSSPHILFQSTTYKLEFN